MAVSRHPERRPERRPVSERARRRLAETLDRHAARVRAPAGGARLPRWAADLTAAVFAAEVATSIAQMTAYASLLRAVADGLDEFAERNDEDPDDGH